MDGSVPEDDVQTQRLPLSGLLYQRHRDGRWRFVRQAQYDDEETGRFPGEPDEWANADLPVRRGGRAQWAPGAHDGPSWWLLYGDSRNGPVRVTLADGQTPPILTSGPLWVCEWVSEWQEAQVVVGSETYKAFRHIPGYIRRSIGPGETY